MTKFNRLWPGKRSVRGLAQDQGGATLLTFAVFLMVLLGMAGLAIDLSSFFLMRAQLQASADAAVLAAARQLPDTDEVKAIAVDYANKNMSVAQHGGVLVESDVLTGFWDADARTFTPDGDPLNAVQVTTRRSEANDNAAPTFFASVMGFDEVDIETSAVAAFDVNERWDVVISQDVTGSFTEEIGDAATADQALLDCLRDNANDQSLVGLVAFTGVGTTLHPLQTIGDGYDAMSTSIGTITNCGSGSMPACSGTHVGAGIEEANAVFGAVPVGPEIGRAMVVVGDGAPNASGPNAGMSNADLENLARQAADAADADGISVFPVFYDQNSDDVAAAFFESLVRGDGKFFRTPDPADLPDLLLDICAQLPLRLVN